MSKRKCNILTKTIIREDFVMKRRSLSVLLTAAMAASMLARLRRQQRYGGDDRGSGSD